MAEKTWLVKTITMDKEDPYNGDKMFITRKWYDDGREARGAYIQAKHADNAPYYTLIHGDSRRFTMLLKKVDGKWVVV